MKHLLGLVVIMYLAIHLSIHISIHLSIYPVIHYVIAQPQPTLISFPSVGQAGDNFGSSVSASNNFAIIGSPKASTTYPNAGKAYIFEYISSNWTLIFTLQAFDAGGGDNFGSSTTLNMLSSPAWALVGAPYHTVSGSSGCGATYLFKQNSTNWISYTQLVPPILGMNYQFGFSTALSSNWAVVSAPLKAMSTGEVYLYNFNQNWAYNLSLISPNPHPGDEFGYSVAIDGNNILVGDILGYTTIMNSGTAYLFGQDMGGPNNWGQIKQFISLTPTNTDYFGCSVSISGNIILIGASGALLYGAVYVFHQDVAGNWNNTSIISNANGATGDRFGNSVAINGLNGMIGGLNANSGLGKIQTIQFPNSNDNGAPNILYTIQDPPPTSAGDNFGSSVSISNNIMVVGVPNRNNNFGVAYSIELLSSPPSLSSKKHIFIILVGGIFLIILVAGVIIIFVYRNRKKEIKNVNISTQRLENINIKNKSDIKDNADIRSNITSSSTGTIVSNVRTIPLTKNMSIRSKDLDLYNQKVKM